MGLILNLETATTNCSVSLALNGNIIAIRENDTPNYSHAEQLHVFIQECLEEAGKLPSDLDAIAVSMGPGSYTGLRIGVSAAKGLCFALEVPLISIATLKSMASQLNVQKGDVVIPVLDARRMEVYSAVFDAVLNEVRETRAEIIDEDSFKEYTSKGKVYFIGNGAEKISSTLKGNNMVFVNKAVPSAKEMAVLSHNKFSSNDFEDVAYFEPYYLKDFLVTKKKG